MKKDDLSIEEINILFGSIHKLINKTKKQWEIIYAIESNENKKQSKFKKAARDAKENVYKEMHEYAILGVGVKDQHLIFSQFFIFFKNKIYNINLLIIIKNVKTPEFIFNI